MLRRSLLSKKKGDGILPDGYVQLEYIENSSNAYIDTGYKTNRNTKIECKFEILENLASNMVIFGSRSPNVTNMFSLTADSDAEKFLDDIGSPSSNRRIFNIKKIGIHNLVKTVTQTNMGTLQATHNVESVVSNNNLTIFVGNQGNLYNPARMRLFKFTINENNRLIHNYYPSKRLYDNAIGLYDTVTNVFKLSPNNTIFIAGKEIEDITPQPPMELRGIFILGIDNNYYTCDEWKQPNKNAVGIAVMSDKASFVVSPESSSYINWSDNSFTINNIITSSDINIALFDYNGKRNTDNIISQDSKANAAKYCRNYTFKNGKKGYLPSLGEGSLIVINKDEINKCLNKIGSSTIRDWLWSSTQYSNSLAWTYRMINENDYVSKESKSNNWLVLPCSELP